MRFTQKNISPVFLSIYLLFAFTISPPCSFSQTLAGDPVEISSKNPDGIKYEFVKSYIMSLEYLYQNETTKKALPAIDARTIADMKVLADERSRLISANVNYRIARNLLERFSTANNGLIAKVVDLYSAFSDKQVELNNRERILISGALNAVMQNNFKEFDLKWYSEGISKIAYERKESSMQLLEASMLVNKVLISHEFNDSGQFYKLGITKEERRNLIRRLRKFDGENFSGEVRSGQTFLEASVSAIREILEDASWPTLEDTPS